MESSSAPSYYVDPNTHLRRSPRLNQGARPVEVPQRFDLAGPGSPMVGFDSLGTRRRIAGARSSSRGQMPSNERELGAERGNSPGSAAGHAFRAAVTALASAVIWPYFVLLVVANSKDPLTFEELWGGNFSRMWMPATIGELYNPAAFQMFVGWLALQWVIDRVLPGEMRTGNAILGSSEIQPLRYKCNGDLCFWVNFMGLAVALPHLGRLLGLSGEIHISNVPEIWLDLVAAGIIFSVFLSLALYIASWRSVTSHVSVVTSPMGDTGNPFHDFWNGRELNPRIGSFDLKFFIQMRPGLMGWIFVNCCFASQQAAKLGNLSAEMILICLFQGTYVWDLLYHERSILDTVTITNDGLGLMHVLHGLVVVPALFSLQGRYLVAHSPQLSPGALILISLLFAAGYAIYRGANNELERFRSSRDADIKELRSLQTITGRRLLVDGWWRYARKINHSGDWLMALSWSLLCGFDSPLPYLYPVYFLWLLVARAWRDDALCYEKYGEDWIKYKREVPNLFIPRIFNRNKQPYPPQYY
eukprot:GHVU01104016.1.p1 GENE.GHVU01104016.1~~GHVU01104016.1.p1  ORF type:complete len:530 (+),score=74.28 GHVU01104016.1:310-1899(+)